MTRAQALHFVVYGAQWALMLFAVRRYNRLRPGKPLSQIYWLLMGLLAVLQLYGELWHR